MPLLCAYTVSWEYQRYAMRNVLPFGINILTQSTGLVLQAELQQHLQELLAAAGVSNASQLLTASIAATWPRTARVNLLKMTVAEALSWLRSPPIPHQKLAKLVSMFWPAVAACRVLVT